jgi:DUF1009 family protein
MDAAKTDLDLLGLIAGSRAMPLVLARQARARGVRRLVAVAFEGETERELEALVDETVWIRVGQLGKMIDAFRRRGVRQCVMAGQISPKRLFDVRPDLRGVKLLFRLKERNAHSLFGAIADELARDGIELIEAVPWLKPLMPPRGFRLGARLTAAQEADVEFGFRLAKEVSRLEIGQTVVVKRGTVLAVEGFEGTDACLQRGGQLAGERGGAVAIKVAKENHDMRFDIPCIGAQTIETAIAARLGVMAFEAGRTLLLERDRVEALLSPGRVALAAV